MTHFFLPLFVFAISLPLSCPAALALLTTAPRFNQRPKRWRMQNRFVGIGVAILGGLALVWLLANAGYMAGGCTGGWANKVICSRFPHDVGSFFYGPKQLLTAYLSVLAPPAVGCFLLAEIITRHRLRAN